MSIIDGVAEVVLQEALNFLPWWAWALVGFVGFLGFLIALKIGRGSLKPAIWGCTLSMITAFFSVKGFI